MVNSGVMSFENGQCLSLSKCCMEAFPETWGYSGESYFCLYIQPGVSLCVVILNANTRHVFSLTVLM